MPNSQFNFTCDSCEQTITVDKSQSDYSVSCPHCGVENVIPLFGVIKGMKIGDFVVVKRLGSGGMGEVWLADQEAMKRKIALKILSPEFSANKEFIDRFMREAQVAGKLIHPNIVTAFHAGIDNNIYYLAIMYIEGVVLEDRLKLEGSLPEEQALRIVHDIATALAYAWGQFQILHRDIKPANIMLKEDGGAMLMDMGISKSLLENHSMTMTGAFIGTPYYISPEQAKGEKDIDFRSDMYSLGATLYHLVAGQSPFHAETAMGVVTKHIAEELPDCQTINPSISNGCKYLIEKMMEKNKENRYDSWDALIGDLEAVQAKQMPHQGLFAGKRALLIALAGAAAVVVILIAVIAVVVLSKEAPGKPDDGVGKENGKTIPEDVTKGDDKEKQMQQMWDVAADYQLKHPDDFDVSMAKFKQVSVTYPDTAMQRKADARIKELAAQRQNAVNKVISDLKEKVNQSIKEGKYDEALLTLRVGNATFENETEEERKALIRQIEEVKKKRETEEVEAAKQKALDEEKTRKAEFLDKIATNILHGKFKSSYSTYTDSPLQDEYKELDGPLKQLANLNDAVASVLSKEIGRPIQLQGKDKAVEGVLKGVKNDRLTVSFKQGPVTVKRTARIRDLTDKEKSRLLKKALDDKAYALYMMRDYLSENQFDEAKSRAKRTGVLAASMARSIESYKERYREQLAEESLAKVLGKMGIDKPDFSDTALCSRIEACKIKAQTAKKLKRYAGTVTKKYRDTRFFEEHSDVLAAISEKLSETRQERSKADSEDHGTKSVYEILKPKLDIPDSDLKKLAKLVEKMKKDLQDDRIEDKHKLPRDVMDEAQKILPGRDVHIFGEYVSELVGKYGLKLPPPMPPGGGPPGGGEMGPPPPRR